MIEGIVFGIHEAFSLAIGSMMWIGIGGAIIAAIAVLFLKETPLRTTWDMPTETQQGDDPHHSPVPAGQDAPA